MRLWRKNRFPEQPKATPQPDPIPDPVLCFLCGSLLGPEDGVLVSQDPRMAVHKDRPISCVHALREQITNLRARVERLEGQAGL